jgi:hypothetical protein
MKNLILISMLFLSACAKPSESKTCEGDSIVGKWYQASSGDEIIFNADKTGTAKICTYVFTYNNDTPTALILDISANDGSSGCTTGLVSCGYTFTKSRIRFNCGGSSDEIYDRKCE